VFLDVFSSPATAGIVEIAGVLFVGACVALSFRLTLARRFQLTPLDFLVVFVALALPNLPRPAGVPDDIGIAAIKLLVLFYAIELLMSRSALSRMIANAVGVVALGLISLRALA
jgi:UDP-GlcNAc:undecaprenyl-phosphate GlcNAc-1-phosphate transferase